ncbi:hypothetical protein NEOC84_001526|nr:hypothetical protein [Neochlamydia sp. AcF95]NGY95604.1 hypothetical protein [Neochlamydia sp. AcF84]
MDPNYILLLMIKEKFLLTMLTPGNVKTQVPVCSLSKKHFWQNVCRQGIHLPLLFIKLYDKGLETRLRRNMKNKLMSWVDKILLRKRDIIESVNNKLKKLLSNRTSPTAQPLEFFCQSNQRNSDLCLRAL